MFVVANSRQISHPILGNEPGKGRQHPPTSHCGNFGVVYPLRPVAWMPTLLCGWRRCPTPLLVWITFTLPNESCSLTSMHRSQQQLFWGIRGLLLRCLVITPNIWDSQITSDHLTQARATLRPVRPSGHSPSDVAIYAYISSPLTKN